MVIHERAGGPGGVSRGSPALAVGGPGSSRVLAVVLAMAERVARGEAVEGFELSAGEGAGEGASSDLGSGDGRSSKRTTVRSSLGVLVGGGAPSAIAARSRSGTASTRSPCESHASATTWLITEAMIAPRSLRMTL